MAKFKTGDQVVMILNPNNVFMVIEVNDGDPVQYLIRRFVTVDSHTIQEQFQVFEFEIKTK